MMCIREDFHALELIGHGDDHDRGVAACKICSATT